MNEISEHRVIGTSGDRAIEPSGHRVIERLRDGGLDMQKCSFENRVGKFGARPLFRRKAEKMLGPEATASRIDRAQLLFTCQHGITLNWREARRALNLE